MFNSFDIETYNYKDNIIPYCLVFIYKDNIYKYYGVGCVEQFLEECVSLYTKNNEKLIIFAHNLTFDGSIVLQKISEINTIPIKNNTTKGSFYYLVSIARAFIGWKLYRSCRCLGRRMHNLRNINNTIFWTNYYSLST